MKKRVDTTRVDSVRHSSKKLVEMIQYMEIQHGWQVRSVGSFLRDLLESLHSMLSEQEGFEFFNNSAEAEEFLERYFGTGKTSGRNLSISTQEEEMGRHFTRHYTPSTKNEKKNEKRRSRREITNPTIENSTNILNEATSNSIPEHLQEKYKWLPDMNREVIDSAIKMGLSWEQVEQMIDNIHQETQERNEQAAEERNQTIKDAKTRAKEAGIVSEEEYSELVSADENDPETVNKFREKVDREQELHMKEELKTPPSDIVSDSDEDEDEDEE